MTQLVEAARLFATQAHKGQFRKDKARLPYITHCAEVAEFVTRHNGSTDAICAAWLHDTVEDCDITLAQITDRFGLRIAGFVAELTDDTSLEKSARKAAQLANAPRKSPEAALVKLGDKTSNCRAVGQTPAVGWSTARRAAYLDWSQAVVTALPRVSETGLAEFQQVVAESRALLS